jgi:Holliday junction resolvase RusA-like endonuclease
MGTLTQDNLKILLQHIQADEYNPPAFMSEVVFLTSYKGKVYSKGRPRFSGTHAFTPPNTRKFEKAVKEHYKAQNPDIINHGVHVVIRVKDTMPKAMTKFSRVLAKLRLLHSRVGDVDNKAKTILDAANGVLLADDSQINSLHIYREYADVEGFELTMFRSGLSTAEFMNLETLAARK